MGEGGGAGMDRIEWRRCVAQCAEMHRMDYKFYHHQWHAPPPTERSRFPVRVASCPPLLGPKRALRHGELLAAVQRKTHRRDRPPSCQQACGKGVCRFDEDGLLGPYGMHDTQPAETTTPNLQLRQSAAKMQIYVVSLT